jgi:hypothetical protein
VQHTSRRRRRPHSWVGGVIDGRVRAGHPAWD